ncbi:MAG: amidohydrolase family protein [Deltaproteobacteria bacterium]|nr:amidohydrolase family protein [Deltaproteobacteria bacterium]
MSDEPSSLAIALAVAWTLIQLFGCSGAPAVPPEVARAELCIRGAKVFDGVRDRGVLDVQVRAGRIAAVGPGLCTAGGDGVVDAAGHTLLPGLIDAHSHNGGDSLAIQAQFGVTTTLDMAARAEWAAERRAEQRSLAAGSDALQRADLLSPGPPATAPGGHGTEYGVSVPTIRAPDEVHDWMQERREEGADYVKVIYEHGEVIHHPVPTFDSATLRAVVQGAKAIGLRTVAHVSTVAEALEFVRAGGNGLAHVFHDRPATAEEIAEFRRAGTFVVPTLVVYAPDYGLRAGAALLDDPDFLAPLAPSWLLNLGKTRRQRPRHAEFAARPMVATKALHDAGVPILAGSDAPNRGTAYGASLHHEIELLVRAGLPTAAALAAATSAPAKAFGLDDRGQIAVGRRADLLLVRGDALADVRATRRIAGIWKRGVRIARRTAPIAGAGMNAAAVLGAAQASSTAGAAGSTTLDALAVAEVSVDEVRGGTSTATIQHGEDAGAPTLTVRTETRDNPKGASWAGVVVWPAGKAFAPADLRGTAMTLRLRGDGKPVRVLVFHAGQGAKSTTLWLPTGPDWQAHRFDIREFGSDGRGVAGVLLAAGPEAGAQRFELAAWRLGPAR